MHIQKRFIKSSLVSTMSLILLLVFCVETYSQLVQENLPLKERLDSVFNRYCKSQSTPGAAAELMVGNEHVWRGVYGISHEDVPIDTLSLFAIGSHTKTIISTIILQLYQEGLLDLQDQIGEFLPDYPHVDRQITIHQLLNHTSGICDVLDNPSFWTSMEANPEKLWTFDEVMEFVLEPYFAPGESGRYSNTGYLILGRIIEILTWNSLKDEIPNRIFEPLNLTSTYYLPHDTVYKKLVHPWEGGDNFESSATQSNFSIFGSAGAILSTAYETAEMFSAILYRNVFLNDTIHDLFFDQENMQDCGLGNYGYGLFSREFNRYTEKTYAYGHIGLMRFSWMSSTAFVPEDSAAITMIFNTFAEPEPEVLYTAVINQPPEDIEIEYFVSGKVSQTNQVIAKFTADDPNQHPINDYTFSLVEGDGSNDRDNSCFAIVAKNFLTNVCLLESEDIQSYTLRLKCDDGYGGSLTKSLQVNVPVNATNYLAKEEIKLFPNPTNTFFTLEISIPIQGYLEIQNFVGQLIYSRPITSTSEQIDMSNYAKGIYFVTVRSDKLVRTEKLIKY